MYWSPVRIDKHIKYEIGTKTTNKNKNKEEDDRAACMFTQHAAQKGSGDIRTN